MYKVVLVDDEAWNLKGIETTFPWIDYGFEVAGKTTSSTQALEMISCLKPHAIFCDIRMPNISGIDLLHIVRNKKIDIEFVFISAYSDFKYSRIAIREDVFDYCLKPILKEDAEDILCRLRVRLDEKSGAKTDEDFLAAETEISNKAFFEMLEYIKLHYNEKLQLHFLADKFYLNANYCCYLFKKHFNMPFSKYVIQIRMKEALKQLENPLLSLQEIAADIGYENYFYFSKVFKSVYEVSPKQYRNNKKDDSKNENRS